MGSIIMDNSVVESKSIIAAGSVLPKNTIVPEGSVFAGVPAKKNKRNRFRPSKWRNREDC
jgi:carbonic anhydrase/acetyltransferase-like protein (isoleucine patch superfamily)